MIHTTHRLRRLLVVLVLALVGPFAVHANTTLSVRAQAADEVEHWIGQILIPNPSCSQITFVVTLTRRDQQWTGRFGMAPGCGVSGISDVVVEELTRTDDSIRFVTPPPPGRNIYELTLAPDRTSATGRLVIGGVQPVFIRAARATEDEARNATPRRPQSPALPLPYERQDLIVPTSGPSANLAGVLTIPRRDADAPLLPAVILLQDEDPTDFDHTEGTHKPGLVLADLLSRRGIAVLRCSSPGMNNSEGSYLSSTITDAAADTKGLAAFLKSVSGIDPARIGLIGRGEGALVAMLAAADNPDIAHVTLMAPAAVTWKELMLIRERRQLEAQAEDKAFIAARMERYTRILSHAAKSEDEALTREIEQDFQVQLKEGRAMGMLNIFQQRDMVEAQADFYRTPRLIDRLNQDPRPFLAAIRVPILLLTADRDLYAPPAQTLPAVQAALSDSGNTRVTAHTFPGLNHWFQPCSTGFSDERGQIETTIAPQVADTIADWIVNRHP